MPDLISPKPSDEERGRTRHERPLDQETLRRLIDEGRELSRAFDEETKGMRIFTPEERMRRWR